MKMHLVPQTKLQLRHNISKHDNFLKYNELYGTSQKWESITNWRKEQQKLKKVKNPEKF